MNKGAIQRFAIWARTELIAQVSQRAYQYGITKDGYGEQNAVTVGGRALTTDEQRQRKELVEQIRSKGYTQVMEEVAYTWFNRFIALRFMEVNNYLPSHIRVFSDSTGAFKPEILSDALHLDLPGLGKDKVAAYIESNQTEDLYRYLLLTQCNALNEALPRMFEKMGGYTELLFPNNILKADSVLGRMVTDIPEEDWTDQVQIIGWLYQYYNSELKDETFALLKKNVKITKERIPSATQLFTPDWIVRYMVENSLGRLWIEGHPDDELKSGWKYFLDEAEQEPEVQAQLNKIHAECANLKPQDIKVIDPCMGSGHILVYAFDVLIQIYKKYGVSERDAAQCILEHNLYGLDIDDRAAQLAYFAVMMKARQYDRRIFSRGIQPHVYAIVESNELDHVTIDYFTNNDPKLKKDFGTLVNELRDAKEYGSILNITPVDFSALYARVEDVREDISLYRENVLNTVLPLIQVTEVMAQQYDVVVTNPPYAGTKGLDIKLTNYLQEKYPMEKGDIFAAFISRSRNYSKMNGYIGMVTPTAWLYNPSYSSLRQKYLQFFEIQNLIELGANAFEVGFGTVMFVFTPQKTQNHLGIYLDVKTSVEPNIDSLNFSESHLYKVKMDYFNDYEGKKFSYKLTTPYRNILLNAFPLSHYGRARAGLQTDDNAKYIREWFEVNILNICFHHKKGNAFGNEKWFPHIKGGTYRKWFGNLSSVVNWQYDGLEIKQNAAKKYGSYTKRVQSQDFYFVEGIAWTHTTYSQPFACRFIPEGVISNVEGPEIFELGKNQLNVMGMLNSKVMDAIFMRMSDSIHYLAGELSKFPVFLADQRIVNPIVENCVTLAMDDWNSYETSWDFKRHPLVRLQLAGAYAWGDKPPVIRLTSAYNAWKLECEGRFDKLKANEEKLNRIFIEIYGLQDELTPEVADKDITVHRIFDTKDDVPESMKGSNYIRTKRDEIVSLLSYAVGCMFGRYSLDVDGLAYAGGDWDAVFKHDPSVIDPDGKNAVLAGDYIVGKDGQYHLCTIVPDKDNIIPICDDDYFDDDMTGRFVKWVETVYGSDTLEENLKFIADVIGGKGTPREVIRSYFLNDFYADHCKTYQKRPIYWLFDSGKKNGFKALIYMHRYQSDLLARMRTDYVHEQQERYRTQLTHLADAIDHASASERVKLTKQQKKIQEQSLEIQKYEEKVHHLADQNIQIDLDDGVKHNYELFADVLAKIK